MVFFHLEPWTRVRHFPPPFYPPVSRHHSFSVAVAVGSPLPEVRRGIRFSPFLSFSCWLRSLFPAVEIGTPFLLPFFLSAGDAAPFPLLPLPRWISRSWSLFSVASSSWFFLPYSKSTPFLIVPSFFPVATAPGPRFPFGLREVDMAFKAKSNLFHFFLFRDPLLFRGTLLSFLPLFAGGKEVSFSGTGECPPLPHLRP